MAKILPIPVSALPRVQDRASFLYLEHCVIHREDGAITARNDQGTIRVPAASLIAVLLGPGTSISHQAMTLLGECGTTTVWVGERGVRYYAHGRSLSTSTRLLEEQAARVSSPQKRLKVARLMYCMRFESENVDGLTMQQLRGREGARVRQIYRENSARTGVEWTKRDYRPDDFEASDPINQALSAAHAALYGVVHGVIVALGCSPGLGFVHTGHERSFVYDIADLYKADVTIPIAFDVIAEGMQDITSTTRRRVRDKIFELKIIERTVRDIYSLFEINDADLGINVVSLWDYQQRALPGGANYSDAGAYWGSAAYNKDIAASDEIEAEW
ncbi:type I-E CRISPR-associated endonuclease Cas1 [Arcanobacterium haemolyticum]|nr:type I-E CRISPR-associated endonuclease Cas1 [Arcanobacterium haemolyticum]